MHYPRGQIVKINVVPQTAPQIGRPAPLKDVPFSAKHHNKPVRPAPHNLPNLSRPFLIIAAAF